MADWLLSKRNQVSVNCNQARKNRNQAEMNRNLAGKIPIRLFRNRHKICFNGTFQAIVVHFDGADCTSWALEWPIQHFWSAIKPRWLGFVLAEFAILRWRMLIESYRLRVNRLRIPCFFASLRDFKNFSSAFVAFLRRLSTANKSCIAYSLMFLPCIASLPLSLIK